MALLPVICHTDRFSNPHDIKPCSTVPDSTNILPACVERHTISDHSTSPTEGKIENGDDPHSITLRSLSTLHLLSQCSSLHSLPSLGVSLDAPGLLEQKLVQGDILIKADSYCIRTVRSEGNQVMVYSSDFNGYLSMYTGSSIRSQASLKAWTSLESQLESKSSSITDIIHDGSEILAKGTVRAMAVVDNQVITSHQDLRIRVWERPSRGELINSSTSHKLVAVMPTTWNSLTTSLLPGAYVQVRRNQRKSLWINHVDVISALAVSHCQGLLYSASWDRSVKVWRLADFKCLESFRAHEDAINAMVVSDNGFLYTGCADASMRVWARHPDMASCDKNRKKGQSRSSSTAYNSKHALVGTLAAAHHSAVNALALSPDGSLLYSGACDKAIVVWERELSRSSYERSDIDIAHNHHCSISGALRGHRQAVLSLVTIANCLCSGSADKSIRVWHRIAAHLHTCVSLLEGHTSPVRSLSIATDDHRHTAHMSSSASLAVPGNYTPTNVSFTLYSASLDHDIKLWRIRLATYIRSDNEREPIDGNTISSV